MTIPHLWLLSDPRLGDEWLRVLDRMPRGSGLILRDQALAEEAARKCRARGVQLFIAGDACLARKIAADGVWWRAHELKPRRVDRKLRHLGAAHNRQELVRAERAGVAAVLLSPLFATRSHPGQAALGVCRFGLLLRSAHVPVIALGGITARSNQRLHGLDIYGIAAIDGWLSGPLRLRGKGP